LTAIYLLSVQRAIRVAVLWERLVPSRSEEQNKRTTGGKKSTTNKGRGERDIGKNWTGDGTGKRALRGGPKQKKEAKDISEKKGSERGYAIA